jgi:hypothetical protein
VRQLLIRDEAGVIARFGVAPTSIADYLALLGDAADAILIFRPEHTVLRCPYSDCRVQRRERGYDPSARFGYACHRDFTGKPHLIQRLNRRGPREEPGEDGTPRAEAPYLTQVRVPGTATFQHEIEYEFDIRAAAMFTALARPLKHRQCVGVLDSSS